MSLKNMQFLTTLSSLMAVVAIATAYDDCKTITTFNVGLVSTVPNAESRRPGIIEALKDHSADTVCVQEVWFERDMTAILRGLKHTFPYHYSPIHFRENNLRSRSHNCLGNPFRIRDTPCSSEDISLLLQGFKQCGCLDLADPSQRDLCTIFSCRHVLLNPAINTNCISCAVFESSKYSDLEERFTQCATPGPIDNRLNPSGLLILSKQRMSGANFSPFFPDNRTIIDRGYILATLNDGKKIACTHLTAELTPYIEYDLPFTSYPEQSRAEIEILGTALSGNDVILAGDINIGPRITGQSNPENNLDGSMVENYQFLTETFGYDLSPYLQLDGRCTFCNANPLTLGADNNVIDVVMVTNTSSMVIPVIERVFHDEPILSDHYGVTATVCDDN